MNQYIAIAIPIIVAFAISAVLGPVIIPFLRKLKFGQTVRDDGPVRPAAGKSGIFRQQHVKSPYIFYSAGLSPAR